MSTSPTPRQRLFTEEFDIGDTVYVVRHDHGWEDGRVEGRITDMSDFRAIVVGGEDNIEYYINHPRDIRLISKGNWPGQNTKSGRKKKKR